MMKKIFFLLVITLVFVSCDRKGTNLSGTTYQITNNNAYLESTIEYLDATLWDVIVYYYVGENQTDQKSIDAISPEGGKSQVITVGDQIEKIKVSFKFLPPQSPYYNDEGNYRQYTASFYYLRSGGHTDVTINDNTMVETTLKSSGKMIVDALKELQQ